MAESLWTSASPLHHVAAASGHNVARGARWPTISSGNSPGSPLDPVVVRVGLRILSPCYFIVPLASALGKCQNQMPSACTAGMVPDVWIIRSDGAVTAKNLCEGRDIGAAST